MDFVECCAHGMGAREIALDTSEKAEHLIQMYAARGSRRVGYVQWDVTNYRSVVMSKALLPQELEL